MFQRTGAALAVLALTACQSADKANLSDEEKAAITAILVERLDGMTFPMNSGGQSCRTEFNRAEPTIKDVLLSETTGKVRIAVAFTALSPIDSGPMFSPRYWYPTDRCYGAPQGGWREGQTSNSTYDVQIEKWSSGWRMVPNQPLVMTGD